MHSSSCPDLPHLISASPSNGLSLSKLTMAASMNGSMVRLIGVGGIIASENPTMLKTTLFPFILMLVMLISGVSSIVSAALFGKKIPVMSCIAVLYSRSELNTSFLPSASTRSAHCWSAYPFTVLSMTHLLWRLGVLSTLYMSIPLPLMYLSQSVCLRHSMR